MKIYIKKASSSFELKMLSYVKPKVKNKINGVNEDWRILTSFYNCEFPMIPMITSGLINRLETSHGNISLYTI